MNLRDERVKGFPGNFLKVSDKLQYIRRITIQSNIYDEAFLQKKFTAISCKLFSQKNSIVDVRMASKKASAYL